MSRLIAAVTLASSTLTIRRDCVPGMRAKLMARLEPSVALKDSEPVSELALRALYVMADSSGTLAGGRPTPVAGGRADHAGLVGRPRQHDAAAVDQQR